MSNAAKDDLKAAQGWPPVADASDLSEKDLSKRMKQLEKDMLEAAQPRIRESCTIA